MAYRTLILMWCCVIHNLTFAQCYYTKRKFEISNFCKTYTIKSDFEKGLEKIRFIDTLYSINVLNKNQVISINDSFFDKEINCIFMGKISNEEVFCRVNNLLMLTYKCDTFNSAVFGCKSLRYLYVDVLMDSIRPQKIYKNELLKEMFLFSKYEYELDSGLLHFKKMIFLGGSFNVFKDTNYDIYSKMDQLKQIKIANIDFRQTKITPKLVERISKNLYFQNCRFTRKQRKMLKYYVNVSFIY